jgi:hypothetical protein
MGATGIGVAAGPVAMVAHPDEVVDLVETAVKGGDA